MATLNYATGNEASQAFNKAIMDNMARRQGYRDEEKAMLGLDELKSTRQSEKAIDSYIRRFLQPQVAGPESATGGGGQPAAPATPQAGPIAPIQKPTGQTGTAISLGNMRGALGQALETPGTGRTIMEMMQKQAGTERGIEQEQYKRGQTQQTRQDQLMVQMAEAMEAGRITLARHFAKQLGFEMKEEEWGNREALAGLGRAIKLGKDVYGNDRNTFSKYMRDVVQGFQNTQKWDYAGALARNEGQNVYSSQYGLVPVEMPDGQGGTRTVWVQRAQAGGLPVGAKPKAPSTKLVPVEVPDGKGGTRTEYRTEGEAAGGAVPDEQFAPGAPVPVADPEGGPDIYKSRTDAIDQPVPKKQFATQRDRLVAVIGENGKQVLVPESNAAGMQPGYRPTSASAQLSPKEKLFNSIFGASLKAMMPNYGTPEQMEQAYRAIVLRASRLSGHPVPADQLPLISPEDVDEEDRGYIVKFFHRLFGDDTAAAAPAPAPSSTRARPPSQSPDTTLPPNREPADAATAGVPRSQGGDEAFGTLQAPEVPAFGTEGPASLAEPDVPVTMPASEAPIAGETETGPDGNKYPVVNSQEEYDALPPGSTYFHGAERRFKKKK